jgi:hypothetical protein
MVDGDGEERLTEDITLNFSKVSLDDVPQDDKGRSRHSDTDAAGCRYESLHLADCASRFIRRPRQSIQLCGSFATSSRQSVLERDKRQCWAEP